MARQYILDTFAVMVYLRKEEGFGQVRDLLAQAAQSNAPLLMCVVNWGEVYYLFYREGGFERAEEVARLLDTFPIDMVPADVELTRQAATYKAQNNLSYADSFAAALARLRKATLVTGDKEFKQLEKDINIQWL